MLKKFSLTCETITDIYIIILLGIFPVFMGFGDYQSITDRKLQFFVIVTGIWLGLLLLLLLRDWFIGKKHRFHFRISHILVVLFLLFSLISFTLSPYRAELSIISSFRTGILVVALYGFIFLFVSHFGYPKRKYIWILGIGATICCFIAFLQLLGFNPFSFYPSNLTYFDKFIVYNGEFLGTIGNSDVLSSYLCLVIPTLFVFSIWSSKNIDKLLQIPAFFCLLILIKSNVSSGIVAIMATTIIAIPILIRNQKVAKRALYICLVVAFLGMTAIYFWPKKSGSIYEASQVMHGHLEDHFGNNRGLIWKQGMDLFLEHPVIGTGIGSSVKRFHIRWYSLERDEIVYIDNAHNAYLSYLIEIGLLGALPYLGMLVVVLISWFKRRKENEMFAALGTSVLCYIIQDFFNINSFIVAPIFWLFCGLIESTHQSEGKE